MVQQANRAIVLCLMGLLPIGASAQTNGPFPGHDSQIWTEAITSHSLHPKTDLVLIGAFRLGRHARHPVYERAAAGLAFKLGRFVTVSPLYSYFATQAVAGQDNREHRISADGVVSLPWGRWLIIDRNIMERRFRDPRDSTRYKNFLRLQRDVALAHTSLGLFLADEVVYDWSFNAWVRQRAFVGAAKRLSKNVSLDIYFVNQNGNHVAAGDLHALGMSLKARF